MTFLWESEFTSGKLCQKRVRSQQNLINDISQRYFLKYVKHKELVKIWQSLNTYIRHISKTKHDEKGQGTVEGTCYSFKRISCTCSWDKWTRKIKSGQENVRTTNSVFRLFLKKKIKYVVRQALYMSFIQKIYDKALDGIPLKWL